MLNLDPAAVLASHAQNKQPEAEELYEKALALKPEDATYMSNLAELYRQQVPLPAPLAFSSERWSFRQCSTGSV